jgi:hypothetical protein
MTTSEKPRVIILRTCDGISGDLCIPHVVAMTSYELQQSTALNLVDYALNILDVAIKFATHEVSVINLVQGSFCFVKVI